MSWFRVKAPSGPFSKFLLTLAVPHVWLLEGKHCKKNSIFGDDRFNAMPEKSRYGARGNIHDTRTNAQLLVCMANQID
jgi:hypothetical protein